MVGGWIYAYGFCSHKCYRLDECGLAVESKDACERACIDEALETLDSDPCWAQQMELRRRFVLEAQCDGVDDEELPAGAAAVCDEREGELLECGR